MSMSGSEQSICFYLLQMEDCSRDALDSVHCMLWVCWFLALHHNIFVQVHLPLDRWVIRLQHQNQSFKKRLIKKKHMKSTVLLPNLLEPILPCPGDGDSDANAPSPHHLCLSMKGHAMWCY